MQVEINCNVRNVIIFDNKINNKLQIFNSKINYLKQNVHNYKNN